MQFCDLGRRPHKTGQEAEQRILDHLEKFGPTRADELQEILECCDQALYPVLHALRESNDMTACEEVGCIDWSKSDSVTMDRAGTARP